MIKIITDKEKKEFNQVADHPLQSFEWGEFRKKTGIKVIRFAVLKNEKIDQAFQLTIHKIPKTKFHIGYLPKSPIPSNEVIEELVGIGKEEKCIFIQLEPNELANGKWQMANDKCNITPSFHPLFTKYTFVLDLTKSEEELLSGMHPKTRYNIKVAQKNKVLVEEDNSEKSFENYIKLSDETTKRQNFYAHTHKYHKILWETLEKSSVREKLTYHILNAKINENNKAHTLVSWVLFVFKDTLYYPYGASATIFREKMASNLMMWEAIRFGKKLGLKKFDMWGALNQNPDKNDPWYGFHRFKEGYGGELVEFIGSFDLVINKKLYKLYQLTDKIRWFVLRLKR